MAAAREEIEIAGVRLTSPDKVLYPEQGTTKRDLAEYYVAVADQILPHVARRPITLVRCRTGRQKKCFYQRHAGSGVPAELGEVEIAGFEESGAYLYIKDVKGLIALVQMGVLEMHPWGAAAARDLRAALDGLRLVSFVKTTGGKGLHVVVPIERRHEWRDVKAFAKRVAETLAVDAPNRFLTRIAKAERQGRIFIDYLRNDPTSTAVAPYSTRSRAGAPVAMPIEWSALKPGLDPCDFVLRTV